jgi:hypothetical protein
VNYPEAARGQTRVDATIRDSISREAEHPRRDRIVHKMAFFQPKNEHRLDGGG